MYKRVDYLKKKCTHREYYAQFVTEETKRNVRRDIGLKKLMRVREDLNKIPLDFWDLMFARHNVSAMLEAGDYLTKAGAVCILKEAARQVIEETVKEESNA